MNRSLWRPLVLLLSVAAAALPGRTAAAVSLDEALRAEGVAHVTLDNEARSAGRWGLFIGIDTYPEMTDADLDGCVRDAWHMMTLFRDRFGVERFALLTNGKATRQNIARHMADLADRIAAARKADPDQPLTVVITYAGHGRQVLDDTMEEQDGLDETWIPTDSGPDAAHDIRDDDLRRFYRQLADLDCQVVVISDSCHSGTVHRAAHKTRAVEHDKPPKGPTEPLLAQRGTRDAVPEARPIPGMAFYGACHEAMQAIEHIDEQGNPCGRFTYALRRALAEVTPRTTYQALFEKIALQFEQTWPSDPSQRPYFHVDPAKKSERFLRGGYPTPHATIAPGSLSDKQARLTMGSVHGVAPGARFTFYRNLDDLAAARNPLATGTVSAVGAVDCRVAFDEPVDDDRKVAASAVAALDMVRVADFAAALDADLPEAVAKDLAELEANGQIALAPANRADVVIAPLPGEARGVGIYHPDALPGPDARRQPEPWVAIAGGAASRLPENVAEQVLYLARMKRLMSLQTVGPRTIDARVQPYQRDDAGELAAIERPAPDGVPRLNEGDLFTLRVGNPGDKSMYVRVLYLDPDANLHVLYPVGEGDEDRIRPGRTLELAAVNPFTAEPGAPDRARRLGFERARLKVIATTAPVDLAPLTVRPRIGVANERQRRDEGGARHAGDVLADLAFGGAATRSGDLQTDQPWSVATVLIDIVPADAGP